MNILVTGAKGFVGRNLCENLKNIRDGKNRTRPALNITDIFEYDLDTAPALLDEYCAKAAAQIKRLCDAPDADVHFFVGATQANLTVIAAALKPWQGVLCADSGHIHVHETGSIEAGKAADLIVCAKDPLADLSALRTLSMVIKDGYCVEHPAPKKLPEVERELDKFL